MTSSNLMKSVFERWNKEAEEKEAICDYVRDKYPNVKIGHVTLCDDKAQVEHYINSYTAKIEKVVEICTSDLYYVYVCKNKYGKVFLCTYPTEGYALLRKLEE